ANQILGFPSISLVGVVLGVGSLSGKGPRCAANRSYGSALVGLTRGVFAAEAVPSSFESALRFLTEWSLSLDLLFCARWSCSWACGLV
ncbi:hypothetical protein Tco_1196436, partial [Tanacetum coccineum]